MKMDYIFLRKIFSSKKSAGAKYFTEWKMTFEVPMFYVSVSYGSQMHISEKPVVSIENGVKNKVSRSKNLVSQLRKHKN